MSKDYIFITTYDTRKGHVPSRVISIGTEPCDRQYADYASHSPLKEHCSRYLVRLPHSTLERSDLKALSASLVLTGQRLGINKSYIGISEVPDEPALHYVSGIWSTQKNAQAHNPKFLTYALHTTPKRDWMPSPPIASPESRLWGL